MKLSGVGVVSHSRDTRSKQETQKAHATKNEVGLFFALENGVLSVARHSHEASKKKRGKVLVVFVRRLVPSTLHTVAPSR